jgi:AraC family transcriptional regulator
MRLEMKISSRTEYLRRIDSVIHRLSTSIADGQPLPSIHVLAQGAHLSEFHFMRVYRALTGESLGSTIQRLRLQLALHLLTQTSAPISEIAGRIGYETPQAFAKAFRQVFDAAPSEVRERPDAHVDKLAAAIQRASAAAETVPAVRIQVVDLQPFRVIVLRNHGDYADLDQAYAALFKWMEDRVELDSIRGIWGVPYHDRRDTPAAESVFDCCLATAVALEESADVRIMQLGGGRYARFRHVGSYALLDDAHDALLRDALPASGQTLRDVAIVHQFLNDPEVTPESALETEIYLPIE